MSATTTSSIPSAAVLAERAADPAFEVMEMLWPKQESWTLNLAADRLDRSDRLAEWRSRLNLLQTAQQTTAAPIVGVVGSLNGGKSSLIASLLSSESAQRILVGESDTAGTHRFVFWLPASWKGSETVFAAFEQQLEAAFGPANEFLEADPEAAARQYNDRSRIGVPLIAFDPRLDELGLALLDTPDIETGAIGAEAQEAASAREAFVAGASRICSAVAIIIRRSEVRAEVFTNLIRMLREELASLPRYLLINMVRPSEGVDALRKDGEVQSRMNELGVDRVFAAYHFEMGRAEDFIPMKAAAEEQVDGQASPIFFAVDPDPAKNRPEMIPTERLIHRQVRALNAAGLWERALADRWERFLEHHGQMRRELQKAAEERREAILAQHEQLLKFLRTVLVTVDNRLNIPFTRHTARQLAQSLLETAPWYARPALWTFSRMNRLKEAVSDALQTGNRARQLMQPGDAVREEKEKLKKQLRQKKGENVFDPRDLARRSRQTRFIPSEASDEDLEKAWEQVQKAVDERSRDLPVDELNEAMQHIWQDVPGWKKALLGVSGPVVLITALFAFSLAMVDMGGSTILWAASMKELLACLGLGGAAAAVGGHSLDDLLKRRLALPAYQQALATACDVFGLPRTPAGPVRDGFEGIPERELDLDSPASATTRLPLLDHPVLATEKSEGWERFLQS